MYDLLAQPMPTWKRALDIFGALCGIILLSPLFFLAIIGIRFSSPGPIIFWQTRIGYKKKPFKMLKFRSMHANVGVEKHRNFMKEIISTNKDCPNTKIKNDERVFPFGAFLRKTSIDELPQLFNVLKGEMSLVGPRPCLDYEADEYMQWHTRRFCIIPGITGLWQVSGKNRLSFEQMIRLDILYAKRVSIWMDLKIIFKTLPAVVSIYFEKDI
jgi:lipopolysaccharide/colanic/teichoic acid biosynthesis glycosyltransferase